MSKDRFSDQKYVDWLKVKLSLQFAKEGLEPITEQKVQTFHNSLCHKLQALSSSSATGGPTICNSCVKNDHKKQWGKRNFSCGNGICDGWLDLLQKEHVHMTPRLTPRVEWDNIDVSQLPTNRWECVKLFLPRGSRNVQRAGDADLAAILTLFLNCRPFASSMNDVSLCRKVKDVRNELLHSGTMKVDAAQMQTDIGCIKQLLSDPAFAADRACQKAVSKIDQLVQDTLELSLNKELELKALNSDIKYVVDSTDQLKTDIQDMRTDLSNLRDQQRTDIGAVTTEVSGLKDQLQTGVGAVTTEVSSLRDQVGTATTEVSNLRGQLGTHISGADKEMTNLKDRMDASMKDIVKLQKNADLLCSFINACHIDKVDIGQLAASISTLSALRAETDRQGQVLAQLQETVGRHEVTLEQHGGTLEQHGGTLEQHGATLEQHKRKLSIIESDLQAKKGRSDRQNPEMVDVAALQQYLVSVYKEDCNWENPVTADEDNPANVSQMYVRPKMKIVRQRDQTACLVKVQQSQTENPSKPVSYKQVFFTNAEQCENIYITGNAGMGKTTFCKHLVQAWCEAIQNKSDKDDSAEGFGLLFYVNLREVESHYHIEDMIRKNVLHNATTEYNVPDILKTEKCLIVMDGLDEWSNPQNVDICRGLNKNIPGRNTMNKNCTYLTTTRNWKFDVIDLKSKDCDKHVELCGIGENSSKALAKKTLCRLDPEAQNTRPIHDFFIEVRDKNLTSLTNVPILLIQLITLWHFCKDLGKSQVQLYCQMLDLLLEQAKKHLLENTSAVTKPVLTDAELPSCFTGKEGTCHKHAQLLLCLSKLAFTSLLNKKKEDSLVFKSSILEIYGIDSSDISLCLKSGIFTQTKVLDNPTGKYKKYSFLHKKLQEFLAAVYLVKSHDLNDSMGQVREYCDKLDTTLEMGQIFLFVCGMNAEIGNQLLELLLSVVSEDPKVQNSRQSLDGMNLIKDIQTCVMACVTEGASNGLTYDVHLQDYIINDDTISDYINHVVEKKITSIKSVYINTVYCKEKHVTAVLEHLQTVQTLEKLFLYDPFHVVSDRSMVTSVLTTNVSTLQSLGLGWVGLHDEALFAAVLRCVPSLRALGLIEENKMKKQQLKGELEKMEEGLGEIEEGVEKEKLVKRKKLLLEALEKTQVESGVSHGQIERLLPATSHLTHLVLALECSAHGEQCRPVLDLSVYTQLETLYLLYMCVTNLHTVAHRVERVELWYVTVAHSTLSQFIEALAQSSHKVQVELRYVTVTEDSDDPVDLAAYIRDCDKFTVERCDIDPDDKTWRVEFHKK